LAKSKHKFALSWEKLIIQKFKTHIALLAVPTLGKKFGRKSLVPWFFDVLYIFNHMHIAHGTFERGGACTIGSGGIAYVPRIELSEQVIPKLTRGNLQSAENTHARIKRLLGLIRHKASEFGISKMKYPAF
jgi:hypothetical protein